MKIEGFKKLSNEQKENSYGGWAWLVAAIPLLLETIMTAVSSYKMLSSDKGSVKYDGADAKWESKGSEKSTAKVQHTFYAF